MVILIKLSHRHPTPHQSKTMCGIHATISKSDIAPIHEDFKRCLRNRGPDHLGTVHSTVDVDHAALTLTFTSTVLSLRGDHVAKQPLIDQQTGSVLCWNGEAWRIRGQALTGNDTEAVGDLLWNASRSRQGDSQETSPQEGPVLEALREIEGPFAFIYFDKPARRLYYGRDRLGRRSLLVNKGQPYVLSSIPESASDQWIEVEADGCYSLQLDSLDDMGNMSPSKHEWSVGENMVGLV